MTEELKKQLTSEDKAAMSDHENQPLGENATDLNDEGPTTIEIANGDSAKENSIEGLTSKLAEAEKEILRVQADMDNYRKRSRRDLQEQLKYASLAMITEIVDVIDNLQRAIETANANQSGEGLVEGVSMVADQLSEMLDKTGCQKIEALGEVFDPNIHEAIQMQPSEQYESNHVSQEVRTGYRMHERVVRPAQVIVSTGPSSK